MENLTDTPSGVFSHSRLAHLLPHHANRMETWDRDSVRRNIISYLGSLPAIARENPDRCLGEVLLAVGNCLAWIQPKIEDSIQSYQPEHETPTSVYALAKQLQELGREFYGKQPKTNLEIRLAQVETLIHEIVSRNGGAK